MQFIYLRIMSGARRALHWRSDGRAPVFGAFPGHGRHPGQSSRNLVVVLRSTFAPWSPRGNGQRPASVAGLIEYMNLDLPQCGQRFLVDWESSYTRTMPLPVGHATVLRSSRSMYRRSVRPIARKRRWYSGLWHRSAALGDAIAVRDSGRRVGEAAKQPSDKNKQTIVPQETPDPGLIARHAARTLLDVVDDSHRRCILGSDIILNAVDAGRPAGAPTTLN